jgi:hypothetical protein
LNFGGGVWIVAFLFVGPSLLLVITRTNGDVCHWHIADLIILDEPVLYEENIAVFIWF